MEKLSLSGVYAPIPTPFDAGGAVAHDKLAENIARWSHAPLAGLVVLGSIGEFTYLSDGGHVGRLNLCYFGLLFAAGPVGLLQQLRQVHRPG